MEITKRQIGEVLEIRITGRLDAYWSDHLTNCLSDAIREGAHQISLNMSEVAYMSSAGIRVLLQFYKQLKGIQGIICRFQSLGTGKNGVRTLAGFGDLLISETEPQGEPSIKPSGVNQFNLDNTSFEIFDCDSECFH